MMQEFIERMDLCYTQGDAVSGGCSDGSICCGTDYRDAVMEVLGLEKDICIFNLMQAWESNFVSAGLQVDGIHLTKE